MPKTRNQLVLFAGFRGLMPDMRRAQNVTRHAIGAGLKSPPHFS
jgi:hypothetical protein